MSGWIDPPDDGWFATKEEAEEALEQHAFDNGYAIIRTDLRWSKGKNKVPRRWDFKCDKSGKPEGKGVQRETGSKKTDTTQQRTVKLPSSSLPETK